MIRRVLLLVCVCLEAALYPVGCIGIATPTATDFFHDDPAMHCDRVWNQTMARRKNLYYHYQRYGVNTKISLLSGSGHFRANGPKTLLLHIGKTCGTSVTHFFKANRVKYAELHTFPMDMDMLAYYETIIIVVRDPLVRFISAYNFQHPNGEDPLPDSNRLLYRCFNNLTDLGERIFEDSECGRLGRSDSTTHMGIGYCSYVGGHEVRSNLLKRKNLLVIRADRCEADSVRAAEIVTSNTVSGTSKEGLTSYKMPQIYVRKKRSSMSTSLSPLARDNLLRWLQVSGETPLYSDILKAGERS